VTRKFEERVKVRREMFKQFSELRWVDVLSGSFRILRHREVRHRKKFLLFMREFEHSAKVNELAANGRVGVPFSLPPADIVSNFVCGDERSGHALEKLIEVV
jgi:hypothetical protein